MTGPLLALAGLLAASPCGAAPIGSGLESAHAAASSFFGAGGLSLPEPPAAVSRGRSVAEVAPPWLIAEECPGCAEAKDKVLAGLRLLYGTPSGRGYERLLTRDGARIRVYDGGSLMVTDGDSLVHAGPDFVNEKADWQMAVFMAHELEHIHQGNAGLKGDGSIGVREMAALLKQGRVWVELGGPVRDEDWGQNGSNSQDMWAWLEYPWSTLTAMLLRTEKTADLSREDVRRYWEETLESEARWRQAWSGRFPKGRDSRAAALFILRQAMRFTADPGPGEVSDWLPEALEKAARVEAGGRMALPGEPSGKDRTILGALPGGARVVREGGSWTLRRP